MIKKTLRTLALCLGVSTLAVLTGGCASQDDTAMGLAGGVNRRPYTPNFFDSYNSSIQYFESSRTTMVEGNSPLMENTFTLTPEQRMAIDQVRQHRELQEELNW